MYVINERFTQYLQSKYQSPFNIRIIGWEFKPNYNFGHWSKKDFNLAYQITKISKEANMTLISFFKIKSIKIFSNLKR
jgi:hypothetical protein